MPRSAYWLTPWRKAALFILPILLLVVYAETLDHPFYFDDTTNITENPHIRLEEFNLAGLKRAVTGSYGRNRPVANLSFAFNYLFGGYNPALYRLVNILIHGLNGLLLFQLLLLTLRMPASSIPRDLDRRWFKVNATSLAIGFGSGLMMLLIWAIFNPGSGLLDFIFAAYSHRDFTMEQRLLTELRVVVFYVSLFLWPYPERLTLLHDFPCSISKRPTSICLPMLTQMSTTIWA